MSENEDVRKDGYYTVILCDKDRKQTFFAQCYSHQGRLYSLPMYTELNSAFVKEVFIDSYREKL